MVIEANKELKFEHLLSLRKKMTQAKMQQEMQDIEKFLKEKSLVKSGPVITTTFAAEQVRATPVFDMEVLIPLDSPFESTGNYVYKKWLHLVDAVCIHHVGNPAGLQNSYNELNDYITQNKLQPITSGYNVTVSEPKPGEPMDNFKVDVYIGINPSVL